MKRSLLLAACCAAAFSLPGAVTATPAGDDSTVSDAITPKVIARLGDELKRNLKLTVKNAVSPYFIGYKLTEVEVNDVVGTMGSTLVKNDRHFVLIEAHVHVGTYQFDNSNFVAAGQDTIDGIVGRSLPLEATEDLAVRGAWRATDSAYKEALLQLDAKQEALKSGVSGGSSDLPSYTSAKPIKSSDPVLVPKLEELPKLVARVEKVSEVFKDDAHVRDSRVSFTSFLERRWYINSEGAKAHDTRRVTGVVIWVNGQANDGQELNLYFSRYGITAKDLPNDKGLIAEAERLSETLQKLQKAPLIDKEYKGPILFEGEGAVGIARHTLSRHLSGTPLPVGLSDDDTKRFGGELVNSIGRKVTSSILTVVDDPTTNRYKKFRLIGGYKFDDEGVASKRVSVIKSGKLQTLLMSRTPSEKIKESNGHARLSMPGGVFRGSTTNLIISAKGGKTRKQLVKKLLSEAREEGLEYGLIIRQFDDPAITANPDLPRLQLVQLLQGLDMNAPPPATLAYKVYANGKEELVRGVQLKPVPQEKWRDVIMAGRSLTVKNYLSSTEGVIAFKLRGGEDGIVPSAGVESSVVTPDLLFKVLTVKRSAFGTRDLPAVPAP